MAENIWFIAAIWMGLAFVAGLVSIRTGISVALIEILVGVVAGNISFGGKFFHSVPKLARTRALRQQVRCSSRNRHNRRLYNCSSATFALVNCHESNQSIVCLRAQQRPQPDGRSVSESFWGGKI